MKIENGASNQTGPKTQNQELDWINKKSLGSSSTS